MRQEIFNLRRESSSPTKNLVIDCIFLILLTIFAYLSVQGSLLISGNGVSIDGDLQTYSQSMVGQAFPTYFKADPVLQEKSEANSIWNLECAIAKWLTSDQNYAAGLLRAGGVVIFVHYLSWYILGCRLFQKRSLAFLLAILTGMTVWIGWGTFWGALHSDPVPRVLHAALWPYMLMLAIKGYRQVAWRPFAMLCAGAGIWVHGISALNTGAMFFLAFLLHRPNKSRTKWRVHALNCFISLFMFLLPVLLFLWPSLVQQQNFSGFDLSMFQEMWNIRWKEDYSDYWGSLQNLFSLSNPACYLILSGLLVCPLSMSCHNRPVRILARMLPAFLFALVLVFLFALAEMRYAADFGRLTMGHELVRGLKFLVPLSWLMLLACLDLIWQRIPNKLSIFLVSFLCMILAVFTVDKQYIAFQYALSDVLKIELPLKEAGDALKTEADCQREVLEKIKEIVPKGESVFSPDEVMAIRYIALRPLVYTFKDGYVFFYNKDLFKVRQWLEYYTLLHDPGKGLIFAWQKSQAQWLLHRKDEQEALKIFEIASIVWQNKDWMIAKIR